MHRADPYADRPPRRRQGRRDPLPPRGGPVSTLLQPPPHLGPAPLTPRRTRVTIRETRTAPHRPWLRGYRVHPLDVITVLLGFTVVIAIFWTH